MKRGAEEGRNVPATLARQELNDDDDDEAGSCCEQRLARCYSLGRLVSSRTDPQETGLRMKMRTHTHTMMSVR